MVDASYSFKVRVEKLPEGQYLATSEDFPGLVAQGRTIEETLEIAHDVARKLIESYEEHGDPLPPALRPLGESTILDVTVAVTTMGYGAANGSLVTIVALNSQTREQYSFHVPSRCGWSHAIALSGSR